MTKEETILCLKGMKNYARDTFTEQMDWQTSLDMAIKALEHELCGDVISRKQLERELNAQIAVKAIPRETALDMLEHLPAVDAIIIPPNATNGDMIKAIFPNAIISISDESDYVEIRKYDILHTFTNHCDIPSMPLLDFSVHKNWWNAPYKEHKDD